MNTEFETWPCGSLIEFVENSSHHDAGLLLVNLSTKKLQDMYELASEFKCTSRKIAFQRISWELDRRLDQQIEKAQCEQLEALEKQKVASNLDNK